MEKEKAISFPEVHEITSLSRTTIWRMENVGTFPARFLLSPGRVGWPKSKVLEWVAAREKARECHNGPRRSESLAA